MSSKFIVEEVPEGSIAGYFLSRYDKSEQKQEAKDPAAENLDFLLGSYLKEVDYAGKLIVKHLNFIDTLASEMFERFGENVFLAGGFYKDLFSRLVPKDFDFFFTDKETFQEAYEYFSTLPRLGGEARPPKLKYENNNAVSYQMGNSYLGDEIYSSVELIKKDFNDVETTLDRFDFTVTKAAFFRKNGKTFIMKHIDIDKDVSYRTLRFENIESVKTENIVERVLRYQGYGFKITRDSCVAALSKISEADLKSQGVTADEALSLWLKKSAKKSKRAGAQDEHNLFYDFDYSDYRESSEDIYGANYGLTRAFRYFVKNLTYGIKDQDDLCGIEKIELALNDELQKLPAITPLWDQRLSSVKPSTSILELLTTCNKYGDINKTAEIMFFVSSPVSFIGRRNYPGTFFSCCGKKSPYTATSHTEDTGGKLVLVDGVETFACRSGNYRFNRDESAEIVTVLINKYGIDETIKMLNGIYSSVVAEKLPSYDIWISNIQDEIFTPDMDASLFFDLVSEEIIDEEEMWRQQEAERAPF